MSLQAKRDFIALPKDEQARQLREQAEAALPDYQTDAQFLRHMADSLVPLHDWVLEDKARLNAIADKLEAA